MDSYIPNVAEAPVPIPYGELTYSAIEDTPNPHPITVTNPLQIHEFPETPQGAVTFQALTRVQEFLSHGFATQTTPPLPVPFGSASPLNFSSPFTTVSVALTTLIPNLISFPLFHPSRMSTFNS